MKNTQVETERKTSCLLFLFFIKGLELLANILRVKDNHQPTVILKALPTDFRAEGHSAAILSELRYRTDPSKKIIVSLSQKSLERFLIDVRSNHFFFASPAFRFLFQAQNLGIVSTYYHILVVGVVRSFLDRFIRLHLYFRMQQN